MAGREKNCKWFFADQPPGGREIGPNNAMEQSFKKHPYASLVRESIQNSLDAVLDNNEPVRMKYEFREMKSEDYPNFFDLRNHIQGCIDYYPKNTNAKAKYEPMVQALSDYYGKATIQYIRVSDFNTKGMAYDCKDTNSPFYAFVRSAGVSAKDNTSAGGSFGFGKAAYFLISPINTIIVSTYTDNGDSYFEGVASLCTHLYNGEVKMDVGYYDDSEGKPVNQVENIPSIFRRAEPGTDINILGCDFYFRDEIKREMTEAVLRNFWMAIFNGKLEVQIGGNIFINRENLQGLMEEYFPDEEDKTRKSGYDNPRPYFDAVRYAETSERFIKFEDNLALLGHVVFYVNKQKGVNDKIAYIRDLQMLVFSKKNKTNYGFNAVFYCDDPKGNEILRFLENPAHDEWSVSNWPRKGQKGYAKQVLQEVENFKNSCVNKLFNSNTKAAIDIKGLEEFLYIPTTIDEDDDLEAINDDEDNVFGKPTGELMDEGASVTTDIPKGEDNPTISKPRGETPTGHVMINKTTNASPSKEGSLKSGNSKANKKPKSPGIIKPGDIKESQIEDENGKHGIFASPISLPYRAFSQNENGEVCHYVVLHSEEEITSLRLRFFGVGEETNEELKVIGTNAGEIDGNLIKNIHLSEGTTRLRIKFADNMKHSIKLSAEEEYEI